MPFRIECGHQMWTNEHDILHREDGPALVADHTKQWFINGREHKIDGPAVEYYDNNILTYQAWFIDGLRHRADGPAIETISRKEWWYRGHHYSTIDDFIQNAEFESDEQKMLFYLKNK